MATRTYSNFSWTSSSSRLSDSLASSSPYVSSFGSYSYSSSSVLHTSSHRYHHPHLPQQPQLQPQQHHRRVERVSTPVQHVYSLHEAATYANENAVALALHSGADVNACDESGRTALTCVIGGERWEDVDASDASYLLEKRLNIIKMLLEHPEISLQVLNAPQAVIRGATLLGLAAWLDIPEAVRILLEHCPGMVAVDGMDAFGATALMYAARDGGVRVMQYLLVNGARPDYRDIHHRTSVQHALKHPQALWLCECALRRHRSRETINEANKRHLVHTDANVDDLLAAIPLAHLHPRFHQPPVQEITSMTHSLISAIHAGDVHWLHSVLYSSIHSKSTLSSSIPALLINAQDEHGWSPIHYCVSVEEPNRAILDVLYRSGADVSLYTSENDTPLHCLAFRARPSDTTSIHSFVRHFVHDLRAPMSATNGRKETCIHVAAQYGQSVEVLAALLACDPTGEVREMHNAEGFTAAEVCKPEFRALFGLEIERCTSSLSVRTIKASTTSTRSSASLASIVAQNVKRQNGINFSRVPMTDADISTFPGLILDGLHQISFEVSKKQEDSEYVMNISGLQDRLWMVGEMGDELTLHLKSRVDELLGDLKLMRQKFQQVNGVVDGVTRMIECTFGERFMEIERSWDQPDSVRRRTTDSADSETTAVSETGFMVLRKKTSEAVIKIKKVDVAVSACLDDEIPRQPNVKGASAQMPSTPPIIVHPAPVDARKFGTVRNPLAEYELNRLTPSAEENGFRKLVSPWMKDLPKRKSKINLRMKSMENIRAASASPVDPENLKKDSSKSTIKLKSWFKKKVHAEPHMPLVLVRDLDEENCPVGHEVKGSTCHTRNAMSISAHLRPRSSKIVSPARRNDRETARRIIASCGKDLSRIQETVKNADKYISHASRSISKADRIIKKIISQREASLDRLQLIQQLGGLNASHISLLCSSQSEDSFEEEEGDDSFDFLPVTNPSSPRDSVLVFPRPPPSSNSSVVSLNSRASTLTKGDDEEELRTLRRLIMRKIDARIDSAVEEIEKVNHWLRVVRETAVGLKKNTQI